MRPSHTSISCGGLVDHRAVGTITRQFESVKGRIFSDEHTDIPVFHPRRHKARGRGWWARNIDSSANPVQGQDVPVVQILPCDDMLQQSLSKPCQPGAESCGRGTTRTDLDCLG